MRFLFIIILLVNITIAADNIQPLTEKWTPYQIETKNGLKGISIDLVKDIQKRIGNKKDIKLFPWKRSYNITLKKKGYALFLTTRSKERENLFKWVGPITSMKVRFFKNASRTDLDIRSLEDARKVSSIVVAEETISNQILKKLDFKNLDVSTIANYSLNKLLENRTDLYPVEENAFIYKLKQLNLQEKIVPVKMKPFYESNLYIAFNKETKDDTIKKWQKALEDIKSDGTYEKIIQRYK